MRIYSDNSKMIYINLMIIIKEKPIADTQDYDREVKSYHCKNYQITKEDSEKGCKCKDHDIYTNARKQ